MRTLRLAVGLFTIVPVDVGTPDARTVRRAILLAPVVGAVLGLLAAGVLYLIREPLDVRSLPDVSSPLGALLAATGGVLALAVMTGGLHLDGLADSVDALAARGDRQRALAVMRDPAVGPLGALAVTLVVLVDVTALALGLVHGHATELLIMAVMAGRLAIVWGCAWPPARADGLGAWVGGATSWRSATVITVLAVGFAALLRQFDDDPVLTLLGYASVPVGVGVALVAVLPLIRKVGGITGDLLGALVEIATAATLVWGAIYL